MVPHSYLSGDLSKALFGTNIQEVAAAGRKVKDLVRRKVEVTKNYKTIFYTRFLADITENPTWDSR